MESSYTTKLVDLPLGPVEQSLATMITMRTNFVPSATLISYIDALPDDPGFRFNLLISCIDLTRHKLSEAAEASGCRGRQLRQLHERNLDLALSLREDWQVPTCEKERNPFHAILRMVLTSTDRETVVKTAVLMAATVPEWKSAVTYLVEMPYRAMLTEAEQLRQDPRAAALALLAQTMTGTVPVAASGRAHRSAARFLAAQHANATLSDGERKDIARITPVLAAVPTDATQTEVTVDLDVQGVLTAAGLILTATQGAIEAPSDMIDLLAFDLAARSAVGFAGD